MAATATSSATTLKLIVENGVGANGKILYASRSLSGINPALTDDDAYDIGKDLAGLQDHTFSHVQRVNTINLHEA